MHVLLKPGDVYVRKGTGAERTVVQTVTDADTLDDYILYEDRGIAWIERVDRFLRRHDYDRSAPF